jgi:hypothetical protein
MYLTPTKSDPLEVPPLSSQTRLLSKVILLHASAGTSGKQPILEDQGQAENPKDKAETQKMKEKVEEAAKNSKAKKLENEVKGQWLPCWKYALEAIII